VVEHDPAALPLYDRERLAQLRAAVAPAAPQRLAGEAGRVDAREHVLAVADVAPEHYGMVFPVPVVDDAYDAEVAVLRREIRHGHDLYADAVGTVVAVKAAGQFLNDSMSCVMISSMVGMFIFTPLPD